MSKRGKLLLQLDLNKLFEFDNQKDFQEAVEIEFRVFTSILGDILERKIRQKKYPNMTFEVTGYDCNEELTKVLQTSIMWLGTKSGKVAFEKLCKLVRDWREVKVFNFSHGILMTFVDKEGKTITHLKVMPIGAKTFYNRRKLGIKEL